MPPVPPPLTHSFIALMHELADASGTVIAPFFRAAHAMEDKGAEGGFDPVTAADKAAEAVIRGRILSAFPDHGVLGEEFGEVSSQSPHKWLIDPIDGTRAFIMGLPVWGTLIGLTHEGKPLAGMMNQPFTGERFWGAAGAAHYRSPHSAGTLKTRPCPEIGDAIVAATTPDMFDAGELARFESIAARARMRRFGGDCYAYCMLAMGLADAVIESSLKPFDIVPLIPIIEGAGGVVTDWEGRPAGHGPRAIACGDPRLHAQILSLLNA